MRDDGGERRQCKSCGTEFLLSDGERRWFEDREFPPPSRCKPCRAIRAAQKRTTRLADRRTVVAVTLRHGKVTRRTGRAAKPGHRERVAERQRQAMRLRLAGCSLRRIADELGVSKQQAFRDTHARSTRRSTSGTRALSATGNSNSLGSMR